MWMRKHAVRIPTDAFERVLLPNAPTRSSRRLDSCLGECTAAAVVLRLYSPPPLGALCPVDHPTPRSPSSRPR
eukprot:9359290-Pyramimonas_sp.AAC.1